MKILFAKMKEALMSVIPIVLIVLVLLFTPIVSLSKHEIIIFFISTIFLIVGIALFSLGAELAMTPMGASVGSGLAKKRKLGLLLIVTFILGIIVTIAEPDLSVLASQVAKVIKEPVLIFSIALGVGIFVVFAILRVIFKKNLSSIFMLSYMLVFALSIILILNGKVSLIPLSFDAGGVTTGPVTAPFLMALGVGIANVLSTRNAKEDSFGIVALCSVGPIIVVLILSLLSKNNLEYEVPNYVLSGSIMESVLYKTLEVTKDVGFALILVVTAFAVCQFTFLHLPSSHLKKIGKGILYTFFGLVMFLTAVNIGYMPVGYLLGTQIAKANKYLLIPIGFIIGMIVVLAEPAVQILKKQVEEITGGYITKRSMTISLCIGVGVAICLSMVRIIFDFDIMYIVIPGYFISLLLSLFVPKIYTAIAFDSGGVASGPMASTFILPFAIGACMMVQGEAAILRDGFGIVALIAMTPLISIQALGFKAIVENKVKESIAMKRILDEDDEQIINFM